MSNLTNELRILRHLTAIERKKLSSPFQQLNKYNFLNGKFSILDYGCGKGIDVMILRDNGIDAIGWDPVYYPSTKLERRDIVNLGFVINVIEDLDERSSVLRHAYSLSRVLLVVSAMLASQSQLIKYKPFRDGVITERNTFQKYYTQRELRDYIERVLGESAIAVAPGIFFVFKDKFSEQEFLINREKTYFNFVLRDISTNFEILEIKYKIIYETHKELLNNFWLKCLTLGRIPSKEEFEDADKIKKYIGNFKKAFEILTKIKGINDFENSRNHRINDLIVYFALEHFSKRKPYSKISNSLKRDIKEFFCTYENALEIGKKLLFSVGNPEIIEEECKKWYEEYKMGYYNQGHSLTIHKSYIPYLSPILRIYLGCAKVLYGNFDEFDLIKIHTRSGKVSMMQYDDFENKEKPLLIKRVKIILREQKIENYEYGEKYPPPPLENKYLFKPIPHSLKDNLPYLFPPSFNKV